MKKELFLISGFFKDDKWKFNDLIVSSYDDADEDDDNVFYYGLSENDIKQAIEDGFNTSLEFVILDYIELVGNYIFE